MVSGMIREVGMTEAEKADSEVDPATFSWTGDQGIVEGNIIKLRAILASSEFNSFRIETKRLYDWKKCNAKFQQPCPYFYTAVASLVAPSILALFTFAIIACISMCLKQGSIFSKALDWLLGRIEPIGSFSNEQNLNQR